MQITKIEAQVKTKGRYSIFVDEQFAFGLSELGLLNSGLRVGQELSRTELDEFKAAADADKLYERALDLILRRPRSEWEIRDYLKRKKADEATIADIVGRLGTKGFIDDESFARRWVESRRLLKPISRRKLELELRQKRVSGQVINRVLAADEADEYEILMQDIAKRRRQSRYQDETKLMQYLARQGYAYEDIKRALADDAG